MVFRLPLGRPAGGADGEIATTALLDALDGPAALCCLDGAIVVANGAWTAQMGRARRLPSAGGGLFAAFNAARRGEPGEGLICAGADEAHASVAAVGPGHFLVRLAAPKTQAEARLANGPIALDAFAATSPFGAALIAGPDPFAGEIIELNDALGLIAGPDARIGASLADLLTERSLSEARTSHAEGRDGPFEATLADDKTVNLYLAGAGDRTVAYLLDVTQQKEMQLRLAQRNKMEAIAQLAGGVAHDFNNLLSAIKLRADELLVRHSLGDPSYDSLAEIRQTVDRAAGVVRQLLTFSRKATIQRESIDLGEALTNFEVLLHRLVPGNVRLTAHYGRNLPKVRVDRAQMENAVMNLVVNARDAVKTNGGGTISLRAARLTGQEAAELDFPGSPPAEVALIEVADDGPGIPPGALANIFEPFFTTKPQGEGTGLGLATVHGIVKQAEGWITVDSKPGLGTAFRIFLPVHTPPLSLEQPVASDRRLATRDLSGAGRILFVEDEPLVRGIAARLLRDRGYEVIEASDGEEALELARTHAGAIDLMISDVIMPGMDGPALLKAARPFLGDAPVMFISGYAEAEFSDLLEGEAGVSFLPKPLDIKSLAERVKAHLRPAEPAT